MIEDIKDMSLAERNRRINKRQFWQGYFRCLPVTLFMIGAMTLFAIFMTGNFLGAFTEEYAAETAGKFVTMAILFFGLYAGLYTLSNGKKFMVSNFLLVSILIAVTYIVCMSTIRFLNVYAVPLALVVLVVVELVDRRTALFALATTTIMLLVSCVFTDQLAGGELLLGEVVASIIWSCISAVGVIFFTDKHLTRLKFLIRSLLASLIAIPLVIISTLAAGDLNIQVLFNVLWHYGAAVASILVFMPIVTVLESAFNIADDFRLDELTNLSQPLLKRLASEAPGTFNHSLVVGNLAEACANSIGENPHLAKCAAYYHDIGKLKAPIYFSENQSNYNPHDELIPEVSVSMITSHTLFGEILAKQYRLPPEIVAVCREHHGTTPVGYFYRKALAFTEDAQLPSVDYAYSGPKPQSKVAAIVMISDTVEAALRANMPETKEAFEEKIDGLVQEKMNAGQFDECPITFNDLALIKKTIVEVLPSVHHSRISYEKKK